MLQTTACRVQIDRHKVEAELAPGPGQLGVAAEEFGRAATESPSLARVHRGGRAAPRTLPPQPHFHEDQGAPLPNQKIDLPTTPPAVGVENLASDELEKMGGHALRDRTAPHCLRWGSHVDGGGG